MPVGLVESAWGGTRIESWSSPDALAACPADTTAGCGPPLLGPGQWPRMNSSNSGNLCSVRTDTTTVYRSKTLTLSLTLTLTSARYILYIELRPEP